MMKVDPDQNLADIRDMIRKYEDEVPELKEVKLSANKDELIEQTNQALEDYLERITSLGEQPELHMDIAGEPVVTGAGPDGLNREDTGAESQDARFEGEGTPLEDARQEVLGEDSEEEDSEGEGSEEEGPEEDSEEEGSGQESKEESPEEESSEENVGAPGQATAPPTSPHSPEVI